MMHSEQIDQITVAIAKAQSKIEHPVKDSSNPYFKSSYADLASVLEVCREPLSANGLAVTQVISSVEGKQVLVTLLSHSSGQWIKSFIELPIQKPGPQELGSCITYCRRYALAAMIGVYQVDDDAEAAQEDYRKDESPSIISDKQHTLLVNKLQFLGDNAATNYILENLKIESLNDVPKTEFNRTLEWVNKKIEAKKEKKHAK